MRLRDPQPIDSRWETTSFLMGFHSFVFFGWTVGWYDSHIPGSPRWHSSTIGEDPNGCPKRCRLSSSDKFHLLSWGTICIRLWTSCSSPSSPKRMWICSCLLFLECQCIFLTKCSGFHLRLHISSTRNWLGNPQVPSHSTIQVHSQCRLSSLIFPFRLFIDFSRLQLSFTC